MRPAINPVKSAFEHSGRIYDARARGTNTAGGVGEVGSMCVSNPAAVEKHTVEGYYQLCTP